jgi:UDPglucose 6-dehydrogenase
VQRAGAAVRVYDPQAIANARILSPSLAYEETAEAACRDADVVLHLTEWAEFRELDPTELKSVVATPRIVDGRNALDAERWIDAGWQFRALGRPYR